MAYSGSVWLTSGAEGSGEARRAGSLGMEGEKEGRKGGRKQGEMPTSRDV